MDDQIPAGMNKDQNRNRTGTPSASCEEAKPSAAREKLAKLFSFVKTMELPDPSPGRKCGMYWGSVHRQRTRTETARQQKLTAEGKTDESILEEIFQVLEQCPSLAATKFRNFSTEEMLPLWYFVLHGGTPEMVRRVHEMRPEALAEFLIEREYESIGVSDGETRTNRVVYTLLNAACRASNTSDEVIIFLAQSGPPEALTTAFNSGRFAGNQFPYVSRIIDRVRIVQSREATAVVARREAYASLNLIKVLVPDSEWSLSLLNNLIRVGYNADVLNYALDMFPAAVNIPKRTKSDHVLQLGHPDMGCPLDTTRALVLERALGLIKVDALHLKPPEWTLEGFLNTCQCLLNSGPVKRLHLKVSSDMILDGEEADVQVAAALEEVFATNTSIEDLNLSVEKKYLEAIGRGLVRGREQGQHKLTLAVQLVGEKAPAVDITEFLLRLVQAEVLVGLYVAPSFAFDIFSLCTTLRQDDTLKTLQLDVPLEDVGRKHDSNPLLDLLDLIKNNGTLEQLIVYDSNRKVDYTGFSKCRAEIQPIHFVWCQSVLDESFACEMVHYMRLNRYGRKLIRNNGTSRSKFIKLLDAAYKAIVVKNLKPSNWDASPRPMDVKNPARAQLRRAERRAKENDERAKSDLDYFNVLFGLLVESAPSLWIPEDNGE